MGGGGGMEGIEEEKSDLRLKMCDLGIHGDKIRLCNCLFVEKKKEEEEEEIERGSEHSCRINTQGSSLALPCVDSICSLVGEYLLDYSCFFLFVCLFVCLSVCLSVCLPACLKKEKKERNPQRRSRRRRRRRNELEDRQY